MIFLDSKLSQHWLLHRSTLLIAGTILTLLSNMPGGAGLFAWIMPVPFLLYAALYSRFRDAVGLGLTLVFASILMLLKSASEPLTFSLGFALLSGAVTGLRYSAVYLAWGFIRRRCSDTVSLAAFPALVVSLEYLQSFFSPLGIWGSMAHTQLYNLPLLQSASLFGFLGISALMAWGAVLIASSLLGGGVRHYARGTIAFIVVLTSALVYGDLRLDRVLPGEHLQAAAIMSEYQFDGVFPDPNGAEVAQVTDALMYDTQQAADAGAKIAVWGEGSTVVTESGEGAFLSRLRSVARNAGISIVAAYAVLPGDGLDKVRPFHNKFTWVTKKGRIAETYVKHHPVPGEGSIVGTAQVKTVSMDGIKAAGAICYDFDFPALSLAHARMGVGFVALPGLDWRGMLRRHTLMSRIRAIEGGFSLLRSANGATSMGFDAFGQTRAAMTDFGHSSKVMLASLPIGHITTLYQKIGNTIAYLAIAITLWCLGRSIGLVGAIKIRKGGFR